MSASSGYSMMCERKSIFRSRCGSSLAASAGRTRPFSMPKTSSEQVGLRLPSICSNGLSHLACSTLVLRWGSGRRPSGRIHRHQPGRRANRISTLDVDSRCIAATCRYSQQTVRDCGGRRLAEPREESRDRSCGLLIRGFGGSSPWRRTVDQGSDLGKLPGSEPFSCPVWTCACSKRALQYKISTETRSCRGPGGVRAGRARGSPNIGANRDFRKSGASTCPLLIFVPDVVRSSTDPRTALVGERPHHQGGMGQMEAWLRRGHRRTVDGRACRAQTTRVHAASQLTKVLERNVRSARVWEARLLGL